MKKAHLIAVFFCIITCFNANAQSNTALTENEFCSYTKMFTPNNDSINDTWFFNWKQKPDSLQITVYNRWGEKIFESTELLFAWNGNDKKGKKAANGIYPFTAFLRYGNEKKNMTGTVTLLR